MTFAQLERNFTKSAERIVAKHAQAFHADIKFAWPVDTGFSKKQWLITKASPTEWVVQNNARYSGVLWLGRIGNKGSDQLSAGGNPILSAHIKRMLADLKAHTL